MATHIYTCCLYENDVLELRIETKEKIARIIHIRLNKTIYEDSW